MKKRILDYLLRIDEILKKPKDNENWELLLEEHLIQVEFFQHERLIHLIVTVLFAILAFLTLILLVLQFSIPMLSLFLVIMILLIPYIKHYYLLENGVQKMYKQYDEIWKNFKNNVE